jgi:hypothetical protein
VGFELIGEALTCGAIWNEASEQHFSPTPFREKKKKEKKHASLLLQSFPFCLQILTKRLKNKASDWPLAEESAGTVPDTDTICHDSPYISPSLRPR